MGSTILSFGQNFLKRLDELNHIVFWSKICKKSVWDDAYYLLFQTFLEDYMDWIALCSYQNFVKRKYRFNRKKMSKMTILFEQYCCWVKTFLGGYMERTVWSFDQKFQKKLYRLTAFSFHQNLLKRQYELYELNHIVFFSKFTIRTTWVDPHSLLIKYSQKDSMDWNWLSFQHNFLKRQYGANRIVFWSKCSKKTK